MLWIENNILYNPKSLEPQLKLFPYERITLPFPPVFNIILVDPMMHPLKNSFKSWSRETKPFVGVK
jgi:hypothetical protein